MIFKRTNNGLSNQKLFYKADFIVYVEGGLSYSKEDVYRGSYNDESIDIIFWSKLFEKYKSSVKFKFKAVGSKATALNIASDVVLGTINSTYVAMDSEFDDLLKQKFKHEKILYTYGYSWENDVWNFNTLKTVLEELTATKVQENILQKIHNKFIRDIRTGVCADSYLFYKGNSFFPRKKYLACVVCNPNTVPYINAKELNKMYTDKNLKRSTVNAFGRRHQIDVGRHCYGHLLADYHFHIIAYYLKKYAGLQSIPKEFVYRIAINKFSSSLGNLSLIKKHYDDQFI